MRKLERDGSIASRTELIAAPSPYFRIVSILDRNGSVLGETAGPEAVQ
jgi:hypothetical protein